MFNNNFLKSVNTYRPISSNYFAQPLTGGVTQHATEAWYERKEDNKNEES